MLIGKKISVYMREPQLGVPLLIGIVTCALPLESFRTIKDNVR